MKLVSWNGYRIYIIEDDDIIRTTLMRYLKRYGYEVFVPHDFGSVAEDFMKNKSQLVLMDINLPKYDGFYWCKKIRQISNVPIIFISARESGMDQIMALESGGDDYITKPFDIDVVIAKVKSFLRRAYGDYASKTEEVLELKQLKYYPDRMQIIFRDEKIIITQKEGVILENLIKHYPKVVKRELLFEKVWDDKEFIEENTLNVNISRLRHRFQKIGLENVIETVWGVGYKINVTWKET